MDTTAYDVIIIGAGAAGMFAAFTAGRRGRRVLLLDHNEKIGEKTYLQDRVVRTAQLDVQRGTACR